MEKKDKVRPGGSEDCVLVPSLKQHRYAGQDEGGLSWGEKEHTNMNMSTQKQLQTETRWRRIVLRWKGTHKHEQEHAKTITNTNTILVNNKMKADCLQVKRNTDRF